MRVMLPLLLLASMAGQAQVKITGQIKNAPKNAAVTVQYVKDYIKWDRDVAAETKLDDNGNFTVTLDWKHPWPASINIADQYTELFLSPDDNLVMTTDYKDFDKSLKYSGTGAGNNNYLAAELLQDFNKVQQQGMAMSKEKELVTFLDKAEAEERGFYAKNSAELSPVFTKVKNMDIYRRYAYIKSAFRYAYDPSRQGYFPRELSANYFDYLKKLNWNEQDAVYSDGLSYSIQEAIQIRLEQQRKADTLENWESRFPRWMKQEYAIYKNELSGPVREVATGAWLYSFIRHASDIGPWVDSLVNDYNSFTTNADYKMIVNDAFVSAKKLSKGQLAPDITAVDINGKPVALADLKGKTIFLDFWATWCGPCMMNMPKEEKLMEKYKDNKDVVFLFVNFSDKEESWKKYMNKEPKGLHWKSNKEQDKKISTAYNFNAIPHYVMIDKEGKLINSNVGGISQAEELLGKHAAN